MKLVSSIVGLILLQTAYSFQMGPSLCTGKAPVNSYSEYLSAFRKGPCPPILFHHGFMGASLQVNVDCDELKSAKNSSKEAAHVLEKCSFMCRWGRKHYENTIWVSREPLWKYVLWNDFNFFWKRRECAYYLFSVHKKLTRTSKWNFSTSQIETKQSYENLEIPGVQINVFGDTKSTQAESQCGRQAVENIFGSDKGLYGIVMDVFESLGYVQGLTFQNNVYDFRKSATKNGVIDRAKFALNVLSAFTGKRSLIFGHSYGNNVVMNILLNMTQQEKDSLVREFVSVGPPFLGALQAMFFMVGQSGWLFSPSIKEKIGWEWLSKYFDGVNPTYSRQVYPYLDGLYEFLSIYSQILPLNEKISRNRGKLSGIGLTETLLDDLMADLKMAVEEEIITKKYRNSNENGGYGLRDLDSITEELAISPFFNEYYKAFDFESVSCYKNPGVATRIMFFSELNTISKLTLKEDPNKALDDYRFPEATNEFGKGDGTVNLFSILAPPTSWLVDWIEHNDKNKKVDNLKSLDSGMEEEKVTPKKVTLVEFGFNESKKYSENYQYIKCSDAQVSQFLKNNQNQFSEEDLKQSGMFKFLLSKGIKAYNFITEYFRGIFNFNATPIQKNFEHLVSDGESVKTCNHATMVVTPQFFQHIIGVILADRDVPSDKDLVDLDMSDAMFEEFILDCPAVTCHLGLEKCWGRFKEKVNFIE